MAEAKAGKPLVGQLSQLSSLARDSSVFDTTASFHEHMKKKDAASRSVLELGVEPGADQQRAGRKKPKILYENTYKLEPGVKFQAGKVKGIIDDVLESKLKEEAYEPKSSRQMAKTLAEIIKSRVKELGYERYKLVCMVSIGQLKEQGFRMGSRCCWDAKWDTFASSSFKNKTLFAIATVWGVYYE